MTDSLKQLAITQLTEFSDWKKEDRTIFENDKHLVWIKNEGGFCMMQAMLKAEEISGRKYSKVLTIGRTDFTINKWVVSRNLEANYPTWVQATKRLWGMV